MEEPGNHELRRDVDLGSPRVTAVANIVRAVKIVFVRGEATLDRLTAISRLVDRRQTTFRSRGSIDIAIALQAYIAGSTVLGNVELHPVACLTLQPTVTASILVHSCADS